MLLNQKVIDILRNAGFDDGQIHNGVRRDTRDVRLPGLRNTLNGRDRMTAVIEQLKLAGVEVLADEVETDSVHDDFTGGLIVIRAPDL